MKNKSDVAQSGCQTCYGAATVVYNLVLDST